MKRIQLILVFVLCELLFFCSFFLNNSKIENQLLFGKEHFYMSYNKNAEVEKFYEFLQTFSNKNQVNIMQYNYNSEDEIMIYSTNLRYDDYFILEGGKYPKGNKFVQNIETNDNNYVGKISYPFSQNKVKIFDFTYAMKSGYNYSFYIDTHDIQILNLLEDQAKKYGAIEFESTENNQQETIMLYLIVFLIMCLCLLEIKVILGNRGREKIYFYLGFGKWEYIKYVFTNVVGVFSLIVCGIIMGGYICVAYMRGVFLLFWQDYVKIVLLIIFILLLIGVISLCYLFYEKAGLFIGKYSLWILKSIILIFTLIMLCRSNNAVLNLLDTMQTGNEWEKTQSIYKIQTRFLGEISLQDDERFSEDLMSFFAKIEENQNGFVLDSNNFETFRDENGEKMYWYQQQKDVGEYGPYGRSIVASKNYFRFNPIFTPDNKRVESLLDPDENTMNLLVPEHLKDSENELIEQYKDFFYFAKVEIANMYNNACGRKEEDLEKDSLKINIIYVKNDSSYFTFNSMTGYEENHVVQDVVTVIFDNKIHASYLGAYASNSLFFEDHGTNNAYLTITPYMEKTNSINILSAPSVYAELGQLRNRYNTELIKLLIIITLLMISNIVLSIILSYLYFWENKMKYYVYFLFGYSWWYTNAPLLITDLIIILGGGMVLKLYFSINVLAYYLLFVWIVNILSIFISSKFYDFKH